MRMLLWTCMHLDAALRSGRAAIEVLVDAADVRNVIPEFGAEVVVVSEQQDARVHACTSMKRVVIMLRHAGPVLVPAP
jgi:hypothetical protein